jgi:hypothetical protein
VRLPIDNREEREKRSFKNGSVPKLEFGKENAINAVILNPEFFGVRDLANGR